MSSIENHFCNLVYFDFAKVASIFVLHILTYYVISPHRGNFIGFQESNWGSPLKNPRIVTPTQTRKQLLLCFEPKIILSYKLKYICSYRILLKISCISDFDHICTYWNVNYNSFNNALKILVLRTLKVKLIENMKFYLQLIIFTIIYLLLI